MPTYRLDDVRLVLAEPRMDVRRELEAALRDRGFQEVLATGNMLPIRQAMEDGEVDLLIGDTVLPEGDLSELIHEMRHGEIGVDPFLVTITLVSDPDQSTVRRVVDSGTDTVLLKPFTPEELVQRIFQMVERRKRFVVTTDYIGPDRRKSKRPGTMEIPTLEVPNPLRDRVFGQTDERRRKRAVEAASARINEQKVERHAYQIQWLVERILPVLHAEGATEEVLGHLDRLIEVSSDLCQRIQDTRYVHVSGMCLNVRTLAETLRAAPDKRDEDSMRMLGQLPALIQRAFINEEAAAAEETEKKAASWG